jgi:hypothetical protein
MEKRQVFACTPKIFAMEFAIPLPEFMRLTDICGNDRHANYSIDLFRLYHAH